MNNNPNQHYGGYYSNPYNNINSNNYNNNNFQHQFYYHQHHQQRQAVPALLPLPLEAHQHQQQSFRPQYQQEQYQQYRQPQYQQQNVETLRQHRDAHRRQRDEAWHDEQSAQGLDLTSFGNNSNNNNNNNSFSQNQHSRQSIYDLDAKAVRIGVNLDHQAPFLPDPKAAKSSSSENENGEHGDEDEEERENAHNDNNTKNTTLRALVWPAKDPNGPLATLALKGSTTLREHRKKKIQQQSVRSRVLAGQTEADDDAEKADEENNRLRASTASSSSVASSSSFVDTSTEVGGRTGAARHDVVVANESELDDENEGGDEDLISSSVSCLVHDTIPTSKQQQQHHDQQKSSPSTCTAARVQDSIPVLDYDNVEDQERRKMKLQRESLPAFKVKEQFIEAVREHPVIVVKGETGSGKSTQLPSYLLEARFASRDSGSQGIIGCTQPRRVAAIGLARRVSQELGCGEVGGLVGYAVRLEDVTSPNTKLKFMTDGVLLREAVIDPLLWKYNVVVLDEAHERSIDTDVLLGVMKRVLKKRRDFRLVLMSATIQIEKFSDFFGGAPIFEVTGRTFPVHVNFSPTQVEDYVEAAVLQVMKVHVTSASIEQKLKQIEERTKKTTRRSSNPQQGSRVEDAETNEAEARDDEEKKEKEKEAEDDDKSQIQKLQPTGDILVFMTGEEDVRCVCDLIRERAAILEEEMDRQARVNEEIAKQTGKPLQASPPLKLKKLDVIPCFSTILVNKEQLDRVLNPPTDPENTRRCIVATNVAETSLTIDGITCVIDCGFMKCKVFKPKLGAHPLLPFPISQAQATQRTGRAGRTREGTCYRLFTEDGFKREMLESPVPEIKRSSIDRVCLFVKAIGIDDVENFDFIDPPPTEIVHKSLYSLWLLGALDDKGHLTDRGKQLAALPVEPAMGTVLLASKDFRCSRECINVAAMLSVDTRALFAVPRDKEDEALRMRDPFVDLRSDHLTLHNLLSKFLNEAQFGGEYAARHWAERHFLSFSVLKTASGIREQLQDQVGKLLYRNNNNNNNNNSENNNNNNNSNDINGNNHNRNHLLHHDEQHQQERLRQHAETRRFQSAADAARFCVVSGFFPQSAQRKKLGEYVTILTRVTAELPATSALASTTAEFVVFNELAMTAEKSFLSIVTVADPEWLVDASHGLFFIRGQQQQQRQVTLGQNSSNTTLSENSSQRQQQQEEEVFLHPTSAGTLSMAASLLQSQLKHLTPQQQQELLLKNSDSAQQREKTSLPSTLMNVEETNNNNNNNVNGKAKFVPRSMRKK